MNRNDIILANIRQSEAQMKRCEAEMERAKGLTLDAWAMAWEMERVRKSQLETQLSRIAQDF